MVAGPVDALVKLVVVVVTHGGGDPFLSRFLGVLVGDCSHLSTPCALRGGDDPFLSRFLGVLVRVGASAPLIPTLYSHLCLGAWMS